MADDDDIRNPWESPKQPRGPQNPWGGGRGPGGNRGQGNGPEPDLDEMLKRARENFQSVMPGGIGPLKIIALGVLAVIALWLSSGFYFIQTNENGVVLTFGKYAHTEEQPGLKYRLPWPIQQVQIVNVTQERRIEIGFRDRNGDMRVNVSSGQNVDSEGLMLTGDENVIDIDFVVLWRISNARDFLFKIRDPEQTIKIVAESAIREIIGRTNIQPALTEARTQIQADTKALMQQILDEYQSGVLINDVQLQKVDPPSEVIDAFNDVQRARADRERMKNEAEAYRNDVIPRARGEAKKLRQQAEAYKGEVINRAKGDAERFNSVYTAYAASKDVTAQRLYLETVEQIIGSAKTLVIDSSKGSQGVVPFLPLDQLQRARPAPAVDTSLPPQPQQ